MPENLQQALAEAVRVSGAPGAVACVGDIRQIFALEATGLRQRVPAPLPAQKDTPYDLASLTKVIATTTALMLLWEEGKLDLDAPAGRYLPVPAFNRFTVRQLMTHTAGLPPGFPWYKTAASMNEMIQRAAALDLDAPPGTRRRYSDIGFMILGKLVEVVAGNALDAFCLSRIWKPLGMTRTGFRPPPEWAPLCAATEECAWRGRVMVGEVHDENAFAAGGVSGHAGLFSTAGDLALFCSALLSGGILKEKTVEMMTRLDHLPFYPWQALGWKVDPWPCGSEGFLPARTAFGHTGWTGTCLWLDRRTGLFAILLSNTCHPSRNGRENSALRRTFYQAVANRFYVNRCNTHTGLDRMIWDDYEAFSGARIALLTHQAALTQQALRVLEALEFAPSIRLQRIYTPEHGLYGQAEAGAPVRGQAAPVPITSLYGERKRPAAAELKEVDYLVVDLQDVGARYYTYAHTMKECLAACAETRTPVFVLDRPNPLGGTVLEGPVAAVYGSPVCWAPVPVRHGMTLGEMAVYFQNTTFKGTKLDVRVNTLDSWSRDRLFSECALPWAPPSPNIPLPETALLYVGMCLFEGTSLNEGRGTDTPFHLAGAPWLDTRSVLGMLEDGDCAGLAVRSTLYTPRALPGKAANPRFKDALCHGIRVSVVEPAKARPFTFAVALLRAIRRVHPDHFAWTSSFDTLAGGPWLREQIEGGATAAQIATAAAADIAAFGKTRPKLYS